MASEHVMTSTAVKKSGHEEGSATPVFPKATVPAVLCTRADQIVGLAKQLQERLSVLVHDPKFETISLSAVSGSVVFGTIGGVAGMTVGSATGLAAGAVPALFTFGLSLPLGGVVGGSIGTAAGTVMGGGSGLVGGGVVGGVAYAYRVQIKNGAVYITAKVKDTARNVKATVSQNTNDATAYTRKAVLSCVSEVNNKSKKMIAGGKAVAADRKFQVSAASAAGCAAVGGTVGGGMGLMTGTFVGGAIGVVPALFTFGLSIPICATVGGGAGFCVGAAGGSSAGAVTGGAVGYGAYTKRATIGNAKNKVEKKTDEVIQFVKGKGLDGGRFVQRKLRGTTGGTTA